MLQDELIKYIKEIDVDDIGFCDTNFSDLEDIYKKQEQLGYVCNLQKTGKERCNLNLILDEAKSVIVIILGYKKTCDMLENIDSNTVYFSSSSWGSDYHRVLNEKLDLIIDFINSKINDFKYVKQVDTGYLDDRYAAYKAGLGFYGKNNLLINEKLGSYFFIGSLITNIPFSFNKKNDKSCMGCDLCIKNCPTGAIREEFILDTYKCLSYITQKKELTKEEESLINNCIYGCDICQRVCPHNKINNSTAYFNPTSLEFINVVNYKPLSNKEFNRKYRLISGAYRGRNIIERNINIFKNKL